MSVLDAILEAGGVNELASANRAKLYRATEGRLMEYDIRLDDILLRGELGTNYQMQPGDVITVPERLF
jgi:polysaccharide export outer membrane protein